VVGKFTIVAAEVILGLTPAIGSKVAIGLYTTRWRAGK